MPGETTYKHADLTRKIIGIFYDTYNELGFGFLESVYENALRLALKEAGVHVEQRVPTPVWFRGKLVGDFHVDLLVEHVVMVAVESSRTIEPFHEAQLLNHLRATDVEVGLLLNFGPEPQVKRLAFDNARKVRKDSTKPQMNADKR